jgi:hypothetical protein
MPVGTKLDTFDAGPVRSVRTPTVTVGSFPDGDEVVVDPDAVPAPCDELLQALVIAKRAMPKMAQDRKCRIYVPSHAHHPERLMI